MSGKYHATFDDAEDAFHAADSLMSRGVRWEDIELIVPPNHLSRANAVRARRATGPMRDAVVVPSTERDTRTKSDDAVPLAQASPELSNSDATRRTGNAADLDYEKPGSAPCETPNSAVVTPAPGIADPETRIDTELGVGMGIGLGLVAATCVPGIGLIEGSESIIAGLLAAGAVVGGLTGGIYGALHDRRIIKETARVMHERLAAGGTILSVTVADPLRVEEVFGMLEEFGGKPILVNSENHG